MHIHFLVGMALTGLGTDALIAERAQREADLLTLRCSGLACSPQASLAYLSRFVLPKDERRKALAAMALLGDPRFAVRERATRDLMELGPAAIPSLRSALATADAEPHRRLTFCLKSLASQVNPSAVDAAVRRCAAQSDNQTALLFWDLLLSCPEPWLEEEVALALVHLSASDEKARCYLDGARREESIHGAACHLATCLTATTEEQHARKALVRLAPAWSICAGEDARKGVGLCERSRRTVERFLAALKRGDETEARSLCVVPFNLAGRFSLRAQEELNEMLHETLGQLAAKPWSCQVLDATPLDVYGPTAEESRLLDMFPAAEIRVVRMRAKVEDVTSEGYLFVRAGAMPRLVGIGEKMK